MNKKPLILVVDDEPQILRLTCQPGGLPFGHGLVDRSPVAGVARCAAVAMTSIPPAFQSAAIVPVAGLGGKASIRQMRRLGRGRWTGQM